MDDTARQGSDLNPAKLVKKSSSDDKSSAASSTKPSGDLVDKARDYLQTKLVKDTPAPLPTKTATTASSSIFGMTSLLDALLAKKLITDEDLKGIKFESISLNKSAEELLLSKGKIDEDALQRVKAEMRGIPFIDLSVLNIDQGVLQRISSETARANQAIAFAETPLALKVGMYDPMDLQKIQFLQSVTGKKIETYFASKSDIDSVIETKYGAEITKELDEALATVTNIYDVNANATEDVAKNSKDAPVIKIVNLVLDYAANHAASDVHIEPRETRIAVRYRVDGILTEKLTIPRKLAAPVITRIKILANLKIDEHRIPQDGRFQIKVDDKLIDMRVSVIPTVYGEKIVMRLLEKGGGTMKLESTGLSGPAFQQFRPQLDKTQGMILVTGPTGSGKTQTLAACLKIINNEDVNAMTLEDPVEIRIEGVNQVQVNPEVGLTFANGLRSFLRQDPDVIMVGEIRDTETAKLAVQAALTGHLVLATLHTNDAVGAIPRLIDMGVESYLLSSTINVVMAQRLVRKLAVDAVEEYTATDEVLARLHRELDSLGPIRLRNIFGQQVTFDRNTTSAKLFKPKPTPRNETGFAGRLGIFEVVSVEDNIKALITANKSAAEIRSTAIKNGMVSLIQDGFIKALEGLTTLEEVMRVIN